MYWKAICNLNKLNKFQPHINLNGPFVLLANQELLEMMLCKCNLKIFFTYGTISHFSKDEMYYDLVLILVEGWNQI